MQESIPGFPVPRGGFPMLIRQILSLKYTVIKRMNTSNVSQRRRCGDIYRESHSDGDDPRGAEGKDPLSANRSFTHREIFSPVFSSMKFVISRRNRAGEKVRA